MFTFTLDYYRDSPDKSSGYIAGADTHQDAMDGIVRESAYYRRVGCHVARATCREDCDVCRGAGRVARRQKRSPRWIAHPPCRACKGTGTRAGTTEEIYDYGVIDAGVVYATLDDWRADYQRRARGGE